MMRLIGGWLLVLACLVISPARADSPPPAEARTFAAAAEALRAGFYARADAELNDFIRKFPTSPRVPEALLLQAQARIELGNYPGALQLITEGRAQPGMWADEFLFWEAEANLRKGDHAEAARLFGKLVQEHPTSTRRLEAVVAQATALSRGGQWKDMAGVLQQTNGVFLAAAKSNPTNGLVLRGWLLLGEARLALQEYPAARAALEPLANFPLHPRIDWQRQYLLAQIDLAQDRLPEVLRATTNLLNLATNAALRRLTADSFALRGGVLERMKRDDDAIAAYRENLADGVPPERQRQALGRITALCLAADRIADALSTAELFLSRYPEAAAADLAFLTVGELRLRLHTAGAAAAVPPTTVLTNLGVGTNHLQLAKAALDRVITQFPSSTCRGTAFLNLGWCYWLEDQLPESQAAFESALPLLQFPKEQATARFKLGDAQYRRRDFTNALANYKAVAEGFAGLPEFVEPALYQALRAALAAGDLTAAQAQLSRILESFPAGFHADGAVLLMGQEVSRKQSPAAARALFQQFVTAATNAPLAPQVELAIARTFEQENDWPSALQKYQGWLNRYTNSPSVPRAEYGAAWSAFQSGDEAGALARFTNLVARFPTNDLTPMAQWWVADFYFRTGNFQQAEINYQLLFQNSPASDLACQAQMMAGRVALARQGWDDAKSYFTKLYANTNCQAELRVQALFAHGDTLMSRDAPGTNRLANYEEAIRVFSSISELYPDSPLAPLALGEKANCYVQWVQYSQNYDLAMQAFQEVVASPRANATARSIARVGIGLVLEKQAALQSGTNQLDLVRQALNHYLDVFFEKDLKPGESSSAFWVRKAGLEAGRVAESLQEWQQAVRIYQRLGEIMPTLRNSLDRRILKAQENLARIPS
jgi:TolA-binding protein